MHKKVAIITLILLRTTLSNGDGTSQSVDLLKPIHENIIRILDDSQKQLANHSDLIERLAAFEKIAVLCRCKLLTASGTTSTATIPSLTSSILEILNKEELEKKPRDFDDSYLNKPMLTALSSYSRTIEQEYRSLKTPILQ